MPRTKQPIIQPEADCTHSERRRGAMDTAIFTVRTVLILLAEFDKCRHTKTGSNKHKYGCELCKGLSSGGAEVKYAWDICKCIVDYAAYKACNNVVPDTLQ